MPSSLAPWVAIAVLALAAGCGAEADGDAADAGPPAPGYGGTGAGLRVEEARRAGGTQTVRGTLLARDGETRLCSAILESFPPQCGEPSLLVEGLDLDAVDGTTTAEGVTWSERELSLHGTVDGDVLRVGG